MHARTHFTHALYTHSPHPSTHQTGNHRSTTRHTAIMRLFGPSNHPATPTTATMVGDDKGGDAYNDSLTTPLPSEATVDEVQAGTNNTTNAAARVAVPPAAASTSPTTASVLASLATLENAAAAAAIIVPAATLIAPVMLHDEEDEEEEDEGSQMEADVAEEYVLVPSAAGSSEAAADARVTSSSCLPFR